MAEEEKSQDTKIEETTDRKENNNCCHCCCNCRGTCGGQKDSKKESLIRSYWRPVAAMVYLIICLFDFIVMPLVIEFQNKQVDPIAAVSEALKFKESSAQTQALQILSKKRSWDPLTLMGAGTFHIAFGALLSAAAWTRGQEKVENLRQSSNGSSSSSDDREALLRERLARRQALRDNS